MALTTRRSQYDLSYEDRELMEIHSIVSLSPFVPLCDPVLYIRNGFFPQNRDWQQDFFQDEHSDMSQQEKHSYNS